MRVERIEQLVRRIRERQAERRQRTHLFTQSKTQCTLLGTRRPNGRQLIHLPRPRQSRIGQEMLERMVWQQSQQESRSRFPRYAAPQVRVDKYEVAGSNARGTKVMSRAVARKLESLRNKGIKQTEVAILL